MNEVRGGQKNSRIPYQDLISETNRFTHYGRVRKIAVNQKLISEEKSLEPSRELCEALVK